MGACSSRVVHQAARRGSCYAHELAFNPVTSGKQLHARTCCCWLVVPPTAAHMSPPAPCAVWYEIYTLSRPGSWITAATHPLLRAFQRKFAADSMAAMQREMLKP